MVNSIKTFVPKSFRERYYFAYKNWKNTNEITSTESKILLAKLRRLFLPISLPQLESGEINLHLGCGPINHPKFINIDGLPAPHIHYIRPINNLSCFAKNSVDLIYACHCLEHFSHADVPMVLAEWFRVLKKDGILRLSVPNFDALLDIYHAKGNDINSIIRAVMGGQDYKYNFHMTIFNKKSLSDLLNKSGFSKIEEWQPGSCELTTFDDFSNVDIEINGKSYPVSLNLQAIK
ncbi:MAG: methyltransferase domain-containing protein [Fischerella sp.]|jgi:predicted SAM-dependent methyltransferase|uniref:class I SAM-dependent methyltransferase n=1 Tax=Fischerella sp. TaxID=1191 RepID=UPI00180F8CFF|nr:methyltransferase domain-containing protein [Fischerella sp.]NWF57770.1 methyltransferase domain-containing protein [Fischerella sp.]